MKKFLKKDQVQLVNGGYLSTKDETPVYNLEFVEAQQRAEYVMKLVDAAKDKDFKGKKADSLQDLKSKVANEVLSEKKTTFVEHVKLPKLTIQNKLQSEALSFIKNTEKNKDIDYINKYLQNFKVINEFETYGLFFSEDIVKLKKIYTMSEIVEAVKNNIELFK